MLFTLIRAAMAQENADGDVSEADMGTQSLSDMAEMGDMAMPEEPMGFFESIAAVWHSLVGEVIPAFRALFSALRDFWWLLETFLATYIGEPLLRLFNADTYNQTNEQTASWIERAGDAFWGFFIN